MRIDAEALTVYETDRPLVRVGKPNDGGYVIVDGIPYDNFLSGGICDENSFELDMLERQPDLVCYAYDPVSAGGKEHPRYYFHRAPVGYKGLDQCSMALVKLDIEGDEWPWLDMLEHQQLDRIAQLVIELHSPHHDRWSWPCLRWLADRHVLVHMHGNNWDGIVNAGGTRMPGTVECTFVRRDLAGNVRKNRQRIPGPLDQPNNPAQADHVIDWAPFVWS